MPTKTKKPPARKKSSESQLPDVRLTNPKRVVYPELGITKLDVALYYVQVAKWMLPHVTDRPLTLVRCPEGMSGQCFYQKHPPEGMSKAVERIPIREKDEVDTYGAIHDLEGLLALVQFGALEIHAWGSRIDDIERPDRLVFDLDPDPTVPWKHVVAAALSLRDTLKTLGLTSFVKTTGGKGLHIVVPIQRKLAWPEVKEFCRRVVEMIAREAPDQYVTNMSKAKRVGKIFLDYLRNDRGATAVVAYSTRAKPVATVSVPLDWKELDKLKSPASFTVKNLPQRLAKLRRDPWAEIGKVRQSITQSAVKKLTG